MSVVEALAVDVEGVSVEAPELLVGVVVVASFVEAVEVDPVEFDVVEALVVLPWLEEELELELEVEVALLSVLPPLPPPKRVKNGPTWPGAWSNPRLTLSWSGLRAPNLLTGPLGASRNFVVRCCNSWKLRCASGARRNELAEARWRLVIRYASGEGSRMWASILNWGIVIPPWS